MKKEQKRRPRAFSRPSGNKLFFRSTNCFFRLDPIPHHEASYGVVLLSMCLPIVQIPCAIFVCSRGLQVATGCPPIGALASYLDESCPCGIRPAAFLTHYCKPSGDLSRHIFPSTVSSKQRALLFFSWGLEQHYNERVSCPLPELASLSGRKCQAPAGRTNKSPIPVTRGRIIQIVQGSRRTRKTFIRLKMIGDGGELAQSGGACWGPLGPWRRIQRHRWHVKAHKTRT